MLLSNILNHLSMNSTLKIIAVLAILPLFTVALTQNYTDADAEKSKGTASKIYGSATKGIVCGDRLCSEGSVTQPVQKQKMDDKQMKEKAMMEQSAIADKMTQTADAGSVLKLSNANLPLVIPLVKGLYDGNDVFYISTEASDPDVATLLTKFTGFPVTFTPSLTKTPENSLANIFVFKNGIAGAGVLGFQPNVVDSIPGKTEYSALWKVNFVEWKDPAKATIIGSDTDIVTAQAKGLITVTSSSIVVNCPIVQWGEDTEGKIPVGHMKIRDTAMLTDSTPYGGGQILNIDTKKMQVTFVAHRGFGPDGSTIYYIVTDASMKDPADMMGVIYTPKTADLVASSASSDLYQFTNGISGTGPMGFQAGIGSTKPDDQFYSPMWRISTITWNDATNASVLENSYDITSKSDQIKITPAGIVVNCPFIEASTVYSHMK